MTMMSRVTQCVQGSAEKAGILCANQCRPSPTSLQHARMVDVDRSQTTASQLAEMWAKRPRVRYNQDLQGPKLDWRGCRTAQVRFGRNGRKYWLFTARPDRNRLRAGRVCAYVPMCPLHPVSVVVTTELRELHKCPPLKSSLCVY